MADTYLREGNYAIAKKWYMKALHRCQVLQGPNNLQAACLMARLSQVYALQSNMTEFEKYLDNLIRIYLLTIDELLSDLLNPLVDLSWTLCVNRRLAEVRRVNHLIAQIKQLEEEQ
jgi:hypothetical protein